MASAMRLKRVVREVRGKPEGAACGKKTRGGRAHPWQSDGAVVRTAWKKPGMAGDKP